MEKKQAKRKMNLTSKVLIAKSLIISLFIISCYYNKNYSEIKISGSTTLKKAVSALATEYMNENANCAIFIESEGTNAGIEKLINGDIDICAASRTLNSTEIYELIRKKGGVGIFYLIARDAIVVLKSPNLKFANLSLEQARNIFSGKIKRWETISQDTGKIIVCIRNANSGTRTYFKNLVLESDNFTDDAKIFLRNEDIIKYVRQNDNAIGFVSYSDCDFNNSIKINNIEPSEENIIREAYPLVRRLYFIVSKEPESQTKKFINWCIGKKGQKIIKESGYIPAWKYPD